MEFKYLDKWINLPIKKVRRKSASRIEEEKEWYKEWMRVQSLILSFAKYLNKKDKGWDSELDFESSSAREIIDYMRGRLENLGHDTKEKRLDILMEAKQSKR